MTQGQPAPLSGTMMYFPPHTLQPAVDSRVGDEVVILDQETDTLIGYGRIVAIGKKGLRIQVNEDFPSIFFDLQFAGLAEGPGIWYSPLDGLPPVEFEEGEVARYKNTKVRTRTWYEIEQNAIAAQRKIIAAILEKYQPHCIVTMQHLHRCASDALGSSAGGMVFSRAIGELLAKGFFRINYSTIDNETSFSRL